jgi:hypothetical protein
MQPGNTGFVEHARQFVLVFGQYTQTTNPPI